MFFEDFMDLRFYLPDALVVPNGTFLLDVAAIEAEPWYESFVETGNIAAGISQTVNRARARTTCSAPSAPFRTR